MKSKVINTASPSKQSKVKPYLEKLGRFALTGLVTFGIGTLMIHERYNNYWNKTIFRVQTVDFNILSYTLPTKLSYTIIKNQPKELQHTLDSNYGLSGLIVTDASGQKVIASSTNPFSHHPWATDIGTENLQNHPYDLLLDPPPLFSQWNYSGPHAVERSATNLTNLGRVIGRVYYIRGVNPPFQKDFLAWLKNPFSGSSRDKSYTEVMVACLAGGMAFWIFLEYILHKKRVQQEQAEQREQVLIDQNKTLQLKLAERIAQIFQITTQWEQERQAAIANAEKLRSHNQQLLQDISQLKNTMSSVSNATDSNLTQVEIERIQRQADSASQKQQQQQDEIKRLNEQLRISKNQLEIANQQISKQKELESKIQSIEMAKSQAESKLNELRSKQDKDANTFYQKQQEQQDEIKWLNEKLKSYKNQLRTVNPQTSKQQEIQSQIRSIELAKSKAESELSELRNISKR